MKEPSRTLCAAFILAASATAAAAQPELSWPVAATIEIPHSSGKFDFLRVDATRSRLLAAHEKDGTSDYIDLKKHTLLTRLKVGAAVDTALNADSSVYFVSVQEEQRVAFVDAATLKEIKSIKTPGPTDAILFDPTNQLVYVTHDEGAEVWVIDPKLGKISATIAVPGVPEVMVYDGKADRLYLNIKSKDLVAVIDPKDNKVVAQWPTAPAAQPHGMALDAANHRIYVAGANGKLVTIDTDTGSAAGSVDIVPKVDQIAFDDADGFVYCAGGERMSVVGTSGGTLHAVGELAAAATAKNVTVDPATHVVWTTYTDGKSSFARGWVPPQH